MKALSDGCTLKRIWFFVLLEASGNDPESMLPPVRTQIQETMCCLMKTMFMLIISGGIKCQVSKPADGWNADVRARCAIDEADRLVSSTSEASGCVPGCVVCSWEYSKDPKCVEFNIRNDRQMCELYYSSPTTFEQVDQCVYYPVNCLNFDVVNIRSDISDMRILVPVCHSVSACHCLPQSHSFQDTTAAVVLVCTKWLTGMV